MEDDHEDELLHVDGSFRALRYYRRARERSKKTVFMPVHVDRRPIVRAFNSALQALLDETSIYVLRMYDVEEVIDLHKEFKWNGYVAYDTEYIKANEGQVTRKLEEAGLKYIVLSRFSNFSYEELFLVDGQVHWELFQPQFAFGHEQPQVPMDEQLQIEWALEDPVPAGEQPQVPMDEQLQIEWALEDPVPAGEQPPVPADEQPPVPADEQPPVPADEQPPVPMDEE